ncbi:MAG: hypothetical protein KAY65_16085 [Planctomycetes bacterium]|nr:hypothetical protein [Planctomycetota bacterium]
MMVVTNIVVDGMQDLLLSRITDPTSRMILTCDCGGVWTPEAGFGAK